MDTITREQRSLLMGRIRSKDTQPERSIRSLLHMMGYRFRLHRKDLPGKPDIVLVRHMKIVLVQGCFWHGHTCRLASRPKSNQTYWEAKIAANRNRDRQSIGALKRAGWRVLELWECDIRAGNRIEQRLRRFMSTRSEQSPTRGRRQDRSERLTKG